MLERIWKAISPTLLWPHWPFALLRPGCCRWMLVANRLRLTHRLDRTLLLKKWCLDKLKYWRNSIGLFGNHASQGYLLPDSLFYDAEGGIMQSGWPENWIIRLLHAVWEKCWTLFGFTQRLRQKKSDLNAEEGNIHHVIPIWTIKQKKTVSKQPLRLTVKLSGGVQESKTDRGEPFHQIPAEGKPVLPIVLINVSKKKQLAWFCRLEWMSQKKRNEGDSSEGKNRTSEQNRGHALRSHWGRVGKYAKIMRYDARLCKIVQLYGIIRYYAHRIILHTPPHSCGCWASLGGTRKGNNRRA